MPRTSVAKKTVSLANRTVMFDFGDAGQVIFDLNRCTPENVLRHALHGASQKHGDSYSGCAGNAKVAFDLCAKSIAQIEGDNGKWTDRKAGVPGLPSVFIEAVQRQQLAVHNRDLTLDEVRAKLEAKTDAQRKALKQNVKLAAIMAAIRTERAEAKATAETDEAEDVEELD